MGLRLILYSLSLIIRVKMAETKVNITGMTLLTINRILWNFQTVIKILHTTILCNSFGDKLTHDLKIGSFHTNLSGHCGR